MNAPPAGDGLSKAQRKRLKEKQKKQAAKASGSSPTDGRVEIEQFIVERDGDGCTEIEQKMIVIDPKDAKAMLAARSANGKKKKKIDDATKRALYEAGGVQRKGGIQKPGSGFYDPPNWDMGEMGGRQENPD